MKKFLFAWVAVATLACVGCSKDDESLTPSVATLVGKWEVYRICDEGRWHDLGEGHNKRRIYEFYDDNTGRFMAWNPQDEWYSEDFTYEIDGNTLEYRGRGWNEVDTIIITKLTTSKLEFEWHVLENGRDYVGLYYLERIE